MVPLNAKEAIFAEQVPLLRSHVITKNHRIAVSKADPTWTLTLRLVKLTDGGRYMCQINTEPMITQTHHLHVFGTPHPTVAWRREDLAQMVVDGKNALRALCKLSSKHSNDMPES
ncbi:putative Neurotrimin [Operophtera brumata]|uniref:Putative Neurotrimin n=1 Tax=Operophtera brumata TaxID=104452 RepID=A0A0L7KNZ6_OPEBR|nr:putative Neurotrimin [Operophtera brumata]